MSPVAPFLQRSAGSFTYVSRFNDDIGALDQRDPKAAVEACKPDPISLDISPANGGMSGNQGGWDEGQAPEVEEAQRMKQERSPGTGRRYPLTMTQNGGLAAPRTGSDDADAHDSGLLSVQETGSGTVPS